MVEDEKIEPICLLSVEVVRIHIPIVSVSTYLSSPRGGTILSRKNGVNIIW